MKSKIIIWSLVGLAILGLAVVATLFVGNRTSTFVPFYVSEGNGGNSRKMGYCEDWSYNEQGQASLKTTNDLTRTQCAAQVTDPWVVTDGTNNLFDQWCNDTTGSCVKCRAGRGCVF